jgi:hypothetical protein
VTESASIGARQASALDNLVLVKCDERNFELVFSNIQLDGDGRG